MQHPRPTAAIAAWDVDDVPVWVRRDPPEIAGVIVDITMHSARMPAARAIGRPKVSTLAADGDDVIAAAATVSPGPTHVAPAPGVPIGHIADAVWSGMWTVIIHSPWIGAVLALLVVSSVVGFARSVIHTGPKDPVRRFSRGDKAIILFRAGGMCEYHGWLFGRCRVTEGLEADHVHPHSRGGWTNISNGQALCKRHNQQKRANVPFDIQLRRLEKRRLGYFPDGVAGSIARHEAHRRRIERGNVRA